MFPEPPPGIIPPPNILKEAVRFYLDFELRQSRIDRALDQINWWLGRFERSQPIFFMRGPDEPRGRRVA